MRDEREADAKHKQARIGEYVCDECGGWATGAFFKTYLEWIDHQIHHLCLNLHPKLRQPMIVEGRIWYRLPKTDQIITGLPPYETNSREWKKILDRGQKILPQATIFLPHIAAWLATALMSIKELNSILKSNLFAADQVLKFVKALPDDFREQREYLLSYEQYLKDTAMDPKWSLRSGQQAIFVARSMAGARWGLTPSTSREMIRKLVPRSGRKRHWH